MSASSAVIARPALWARIAGLLYVIVFIAGGFAEFQVRGGLVVRGDPAATASNILGSEPVWRLALGGEIVALLAYVAITFILYELLKPVDRRLSLLAALFGMVGNVTFAVNLLNHQAPLTLLKGAPWLIGFSPAQVQGLALLFLRLHNDAYLMVMVFFGTYVLLLGWLILKSDFMPRLLGLTLMLGGASDVIKSLAILVVPGVLPDAAFTALSVAGAAGELGLCLWLLVFGVHFARWRARAGA